MSSTNRGSARKRFDAYQTPEWAIEALLDTIGVRDMTVLEPCAGDGNIVRALEARGAKVTATDLQDGINFLKAEFTTHYNWIITNPPYKHAQEFVTKSMELADGVVMLLRLGFLAGQKRHDWWDKHRPCGIYILSKRPSFTGTGTDSADYAWMLFRKKEQDSRLATIRWL